MPSGQVMYNGNWISTASNLGKEVAKFEQPNYNPEAHPYPKMLYKAERAPNGQVKCLEGSPVSHSLAPDALNREQLRVEAFNRGNMMEAKTYEDHMIAKSKGWSESPDEALAAFERHEREIGDEAARRALADSKMSENAQAEAKAVDDSTEFHVPVIPEAPAVKIDKRTKAYKDAHRAEA